MLAVDLFVIRDLSDDLILGTEFLDKHNMIVDFHDKKLYNKLCQTTLHSGAKTMSCRTLQILTSEPTEIVPGMNWVHCDVVQKGSNNKPDGLYVFKPKNIDPESESHESSWVIKVSSGNCKLPFDNQMENACLWLPAKVTIGEASPIIHSINKVDDRVPDISRLDTIIDWTKIKENTLLTPGQKTKVIDLLTEFQDIFAISREELGLTTLIEHEIPLTNEEPVRCPYRRVPFRLFKECEEEVQSLLDAGIIQYSYSNYSSPAILLKRGDKRRLIVDFRELNRRSTRSYAAVPSVNTLTANWKGKKFFCSLDFKDSFLQVQIKKSHQYRTSFTIPSIGHFSCVRMMLGLAGAPSTFQTLLDRLLAGMKKSCLAFIDDLIASSTSFEEMCDILREVFLRIRTSGLKLNPKKCDLFLKRIKFLGMYLSEDGIEVDPEKTAAVRNMPLPSTKKQVQRFLGAASWFRNHIKDFAKMAKGLTDTLAGEKFIMSDAAKESVEQLKNALCNPPILIFPDLQKEMVLYTDASKLALGGVIGQEIEGHFHPIAYGSKVLSPCQAAYPSFKREFLALKHFIESWRFYLVYGKFKAYVDMQAIVGDNFLKKTTSAIMLRWILQLSDYDFTLHHKSGASMQLPDMLSRPMEPPKGSDDLFDWYVKNSGHKDQPLNKEDFKEEDDAMIGKVSSTPPLPDQILPEGSFGNPIKAKGDRDGYWKKKQSSDVTTKQVIQWVLEDNKPPRKQASTYDTYKRKMWNQFSRLVINEQGVLCYKHFCTNTEKFKLLICVPSSEIPTVLHMYHTTDSSGHMGFSSTLANIRKAYYWPQMSKEIQFYCQNCEICFINNQNYKKKPKASLSAQFNVSRPNASLAIDIVGPFCKQKSRFKYILTMIDRFTKFSEAAAMRTAESTEIAKCLEEKWLFKFGIPETILSDQGKNLHTSSIMQELYNLLGIQKNRTTAYRPQCNGQIERKHRDLVNVLKKLVGENPSTWHTKLHIAVFALNQAVSSTTKFSPYELMFTYKVRIPADLVFDTTTTEFYANREHCKQTTYYAYREIFDQVRTNTADALKLQKRTYDRQVNFTQYSVGDLVLLYKPIPSSVKEYRKFKNSFTGPHEIKQCISEHNYLIEHKKTGKREVVHYDAMRLMSKKIVKPPGLKDTPKIDSSEEEDEDQHDDDEDNTPVELPIPKTVPASQEKNALDSTESADTLPPPTPAPPHTQQDSVEVLSDEEISFDRRDEDANEGSSANEDETLSQVSSPEEREEIPLRADVGGEEEIPRRSARPRQQPVRFDEQYEQYYK